MSRCVLNALRHGYGLNQSVTRQNSSKLGKSILYLSRKDVEKANVPMSQIVDVLLRMFGNSAVHDKKFEFLLEDLAPAA